MFLLFFLLPRKIIYLESAFYKITKLVFFGVRNVKNECTIVQTSLTLILYYSNTWIQNESHAGYILNCGAGKSSESTIVDGLRYRTDEDFILVGEITKLNTTGLVSILSTLRYFPDTSARKYCYVIPVVKAAKYLVKTTYYYGGFDGGKEPPVFDQIVEGTKWSMVNTTEDYANGLSSYYELVVMSSGKSLSVCLARNQHTKSSPFISALEVEYLEDSVYNTTDFNKYVLSTVVRSSFGYNGTMIG